MNWLDFTALALMVGGAALGWLSGLLRWAFMLAGAVGGAILAGRLYGAVESLFEGVIGNDALRQAAAFAGIFIGVLLVALACSMAIKQALKLVWMGWIDNVSGMAVGFLSGALAAAALTWTLGVIPSEFARDAVRESALADIILEATSFLRSFLPPEFQAIEQLLAA